MAAEKPPAAESTEDDKVIENVEMMSPATDAASDDQAPKPAGDLVREKKEPAESSDSASKRIVIEHVSPAVTMATSLRALTLNFVFHPAVQRVPDNQKNNQRLVGVL